MDDPQLASGEGCRYWVRWIMAQAWVGGMKCQWSRGNLRHWPPVNYFFLRRLLVMIHYFRVGFLHLYVLLVYLKVVCFLIYIYNALSLINSWFIFALQHYFWLCVEKSKPSRKHAIFKLDGIYFIFINIYKRGLFILHYLESLGRVGIQQSTATWCYRSLPEAVPRVQLKGSPQGSVELFYWGHQKHQRSLVPFSHTAKLKENTKCWRNLAHQAASLEDKDRWPFFGSGPFLILIVVDGESWKRGGHETETWFNDSKILYFHMYIKC